jgi:hypothetical protein
MYLRESTIKIRVRRSTIPWDKFDLSLQLALIHEKGYKRSGHERECN